MTNNITLSAYKIWWVEFRPIKGIATRKDIRRCLARGRYTSFSSCDLYTKCYYEHFPSKAKAEAFVASIDRSKLTKHYEVRFFTDKQFGMRSADKSYQVPFTTKQNADVILL